MIVLVVVLAAVALGSLGALLWLLLRTPEILNSRELAGTRGRLAGLAHTVVPGLTRRVVHDQVVRILREQLIAQQVGADVRVHVLGPGLAQNESSPLSGGGAPRSGDNSDGVAGQAPV